MFFLYRRDFEGLKELNRAIGEGHALLLSGIFEVMYL
jgi:hypothetical protein